MAITVNVRGLEKLREALKQRFTGTFNASFNLMLAKKARDIIYKRVKAGRGVTSVGPNAQPSRLARLSIPYIERRKRTGVPGAFGSPGKSNLTYSGQMLESIRVQASARGFRVEVPNSKRSNSNLSNSEVAQYVQDNGRPFFALTVDEIQFLVREIEREVRKLTRRKL